MAVVTGTSRRHVVGCCLARARLVGAIHSGIAAISDLLQGRTT